MSNDDEFMYNGTFIFIFEVDFISNNSFSVLSEVLNIFIWFYIYDLSLLEFSDLNDIVVESPFVFKSWNFVPFDCDIIINDMRNINCICFIFYFFYYIK